MSKADKFTNLDTYNLNSLIVMIIQFRSDSRDRLRLEKDIKADFVDGNRTTADTGVCELTKVKLLVLLRTQ